MPKKISVVIIDTYQNKILPKLAIEKTLQCNKVGKIYTFTDKPYFNGAEFISIPKINSIKDYENLVMGGLLDFVNEDFLVIQWDGFVINPSAWREDFLSYDYIGAPHTFHEGVLQVGNGGFSYRSLRLMEEVVRIRDYSDPLGHHLPEDILICNEYRGSLEKIGIKFAPLEIASLFSFEEEGLPVNYGDLFGFHSSNNFPRFFSENFLLDISADLIERMTSYRIFIAYLEQCRIRGMRQLFLESIRSVEKFPNVVEMINIGMTNKDESNWTQRLVSLMN